VTAVELDPDPTPTATPWQEYLAAAQGLDAVRRTIASEAAAATRRVSSARAELARTRARLAAQRQRLVARAMQAGVPVPALDPSSAEQAWARATVADGPEAVCATLRHSHALMDAADAQLAEPSGEGRWPSTAWLVAGAVAAVTILLVCVLGVLFGLALR
jgi:hypothetical protein